MKSRLGLRPRFIWRFAIPLMIGATIGLWVGGVYGSDSFLCAALVSEHENFDFQGSTTFDIRCGGVNGSITLIVQEELPIVGWLRTQKGNRISFEMKGRVDEPTK